jgi:hypothetical protein
LKKIHEKYQKSQWEAGKRNDLFLKLLVSDNLVSQIIPIWQK